MGKPEGRVTGFCSDKGGCFCEKGCSRKGDDCGEIREFWPTDIDELEAYCEAKGRREALEEAAKLGCVFCSNPALWREPEISEAGVLHRMCGSLSQFAGCQRPEIIRALAEKETK